MSQKHSAFTTLLTKLARVPKHEVDELERQEAEKRKTRRDHRDYAKPGQIVPQPTQPKSSVSMLILSP